MGQQKKSSKLPIISILLAAFVIVVAVLVIEQQQNLQYSLPVSGVEKLTPTANVLYEGEVVGSVLSTNKENRVAVINIFSDYRTRIPLPDFLEADVVEKNGQSVLKLTRLETPAGESSVTTQTILDSAESIINTSAEKLGEAKRWFETGTGNELRQKTEQFLADLQRQADSKSAEVRQEVFTKLAEGDQLVTELKTRYDEQYAQEVEQTLSTIREKAEAVASEAKETVQDLSSPDKQPKKN